MKLGKAEGINQRQGGKKIEESGGRSESFTGPSATHHTNKLFLAKRLTFKDSTKKRKDEKKWEGKKREEN